MRASTESSSDSDSVTRWWTHSSATESYSYERQHRTTLANILNRGDRLPADVIPKIVDFWAHVGWYAIEHDRPWNN